MSSNSLNIKTKYLMNNWQTLSESENKGLARNVSWTILCATQIMSLSFVEYFSYYVEWGFLSLNPNISIDIVLKYYSRLHPESLFRTARCFTEDIIMDNLDLFIKDIEYLKNLDCLSPTMKDRLTLLHDFS